MQIFKNYIFKTASVCLVAVVLFLCAVYFYRSALQKKITLYALEHTQKQFGAELLTPEQEEKIKEIAREMGIKKPIMIRKMNHLALHLMGYHNAFAYFPTLFNFIPMSDQPFLYMSEGFFEDLSASEQRFLIGHEMIHIRDEHARLLNITIYGLIVLLLALWYLTVRKITLTYFPLPYQKLASLCFKIILFGLCMVIPNLMSLAYRRHIEWQADTVSLQMLNSYEGALKLLPRWQAEFKIPHPTGMLRFLSTHPSCYERKIHCLALQKKYTENL
jgi:Zn-dependent protease with chaperone function